MKELVYLEYARVDVKDGFVPKEHEYYFDANSSDFVFEKMPSKCKVTIHGVLAFTDVYVSKAEYGKFRVYKDFIIMKNYNTYSSLFADEPKKKTYYYTVMGNFMFLEFGATDFVIEPMT